MQSVTLCGAELRLRSKAAAVRGADAVRGRRVHSRAARPGHVRGRGSSGCKSRSSRCCGPSQAPACRALARLLGRALVGATGEPPLSLLPAPVRPAHDPRTPPCRCARLPAYLHGTAPRSRPAEQSALPQEGYRLPEAPERLAACSLARARMPSTLLLAKRLGEHLRYRRGISSAMPQRLGQTR